MTRYTAEKALLGDQPIIVLTDHEDRRTLRVACHGAALLSFEVPLAGKMHDIADGYRNAKEVAKRPGSRFAIMAPFAGRIGDARYTFDGHAQDLQPGVTGADRASRHGEDTDGRQARPGMARFRSRPGDRADHVHERRSYPRGRRSHRQSQPR